MEDDLKIDFTKIKKFFTSKEASKEKEPQVESTTTAVQTPAEAKEHKSYAGQTKDDDEISIDFSKIKGFFKKDFFKSIFKNEGEKMKDNNIDIAKYLDFIKKHSTIFILITLLLFQFIPNAGFLPWGGMWMRLEFQNFPQLDDTAKVVVKTSYLEKIRNAINLKHPNLPDKNKEKLVNEEYEKILENKKTDIDKQIKDIAKQLKSFYQFESNGINYAYLQDNDPYVFLRYAENYLNKGHIADKIVDRKNIDTHQFAPLGNEIAANTLHPYILAYIHKTFSFFNKKIPTMQSVSYLPVIFSLLSLIPVFFIARIFAGNIGGIFAATLLSINPSFLARTIFGYADTDAYNAFFPLTITWLFLMANYSNNIIKIISYTALIGFTMGVYATAWGGWWYIFDFILGSIIIYIVYYFFSNKMENFKKSIIILSSYLFFSAIFLSIFASFEGFYKSVLGPLRFFVLRSASQSNLWPNVYRTVAELKPFTFLDIFQTLGTFIVIVSVIGIILTIFKKNEYGKKDIRFAIFLSIWFIATIFAALKGKRFIVLLVPAISIVFGIATGILFNSLIKTFEKRLPINKIISTIMLFAVISITLIHPVKTSYALVKSEVLFFNDAWANILTSIKENSQETAIITSWWDLGHPFKYMADRAVTFDGGSQNTPLSHWVGKLLITDNETVSIGVLRMLNCGNKLGFEKLNKIIDFTPKSIEILNKILVKDKTTSKQILSEYGIEGESANEILELTHCNPPEAFLITSYDMPSKAGAWSQFGNWDFKKADLWINVKSMEKNKAIKHLMEKYNDTKEGAEKLYEEVRSIRSEEDANIWISKNARFDAASTVPCQIKDDKITCNNEVIIENGIPQVNTKEGKKYLESYSYIDKNKEFKAEAAGKDYPNNKTIKLSTMLIPTEDSFVSILSDPSLEKSIFSRLFFMQGHGLNHYKLFKAEKDLLGRWIYAWKVDWEGKEANIMEVVNEKSKVELGDTVIANYIGWFESGEIFDSSIIDWKNKSIQPNDILLKNIYANQETSPIRFKMGDKKIVPGLEKDILGMDLGETKIIKVEPEEGYGTDPLKHPLGNKTLNFHVKIESIK